MVAQGNRLAITLAGETKSIIVGWGCDGMEAYLILLSAILPFPVGDSTNGQDYWRDYSLCL